MEVGGQLHTPAALSLAKTPRYSLDRRLGRLHSQSGGGGEEKNIPSPPLPGIEPYPVARILVIILTELPQLSCIMVNFMICALKMILSRSQWPSGLKHVLSWAARTLGSWVRIPLEARICVRVFLCCVVVCVGRGLALGRYPFQGVLPTVQ
jgi:hypothetical protein